MNTWGSSELLRTLRRLWHRFHIWRAKRMYARVDRLDREAKVIFDRANALMRRHAEDSQRRLPLGDD